MRFFWGWEHSLDEVTMTHGDDGGDDEDDDKVAAGRSDHKCKVEPENVCVVFAQTVIFVSIRGERRRSHACDLDRRFGLETRTFFTKG